MSKTTIPICKLPEEECNVLFASVIQKLKIEKPTFFYPIYKKLVNNDNSTTSATFFLMLLYIIRTF